MKIPKRILFAAAIAGCVAIALLAYTAYSVWNTIKELQTENAQLAYQVAVAADADQDFVATVGSFYIRDLMDKIVLNDDAESREAIADQVRTDLNHRFVTYDTAETFANALISMTEEPNSVTRDNLRDAVYTEFFGTTEAVPTEDRSIEIDAKTINMLSTIITALGGAGSGLVALLVFLTGGGRRDIEEDMLAVDLEMKRVELAKARFAAREALALASGEVGT